MKAVRVHVPGGVESLIVDTIPRLFGTPLKPNTVRVKTAFSGLNFIDTYHRSGLYKVPLPFVLGREGSGVVIESNPSSQFQKGARVAFLASHTYAEEVDVNEDTCFLLPDAVGLDLGAAMLLQGLTAHYLARDSYRLQAGDTALVHSAAGGVGALLTQIIKVIGGRVIATVRSEDKVATAREAGADEVIVVADGKFKDRVRELTGGKGVNVVYDGVGKNYFDESLDSLRPLGYMVSFGNASGKVRPIELLELTQRGSLTINRPKLDDYLGSREVFVRRCSELMGWYTAGKLKFNVTNVFPLTDAAKAHQAIESGNTTGKILISAE